MSPRSTCSRSTRCATCPAAASGSRRWPGASVVVAHASVLTEGIAEHADVVFPAESSAEKEGTIVHPDGRLQRLRSAIKHPGQVRAGWQVLADVARSTGVDTGVLTAGMAFKQLVEAVPVLRAGSRSRRSAAAVCAGPRREAAAAMPAGEVPAAATPADPAKPPRRRRNGHSAGRYLPLDLGLARGRDLAGAAVHGRRAARRALAAGRRSVSGSSRAPPCRWRRTARA